MAPKYVICIEELFVLDRSNFYGSCMRTSWYRRWRGSVILTLVMLIALLTLLALAGNQWILKVLAPGTSAYQTWTVEEPVTSIAFSVDGRLIALGLRSGNIQLRLVTDGSAVRTLNAHTSKVNALVFSRYGQILASAAADGVTLWRVDGQDVHQIVEQSNANYWLRNDSLQTLAFSPERSMLAVPGLNGAVEVWQTDGIGSQTLVKTLDAQGAVVSARTFGQDSESLIVGYIDGSVRQWQLPDGRLLLSQTQNADEWNVVHSMALDPTGQIVAVALQMIPDVRVWRTSEYGD